MDLVCLVFRATSYHSRQRYAVFAARAYQPCKLMGEGARGGLSFVVERIGTVFGGIDRPSFMHVCACVCPVWYGVRGYV